MTPGYLGTKRKSVSYVCATAQATTPNGWWYADNKRDAKAIAKRKGRNGAPQVYRVTIERISP